MRSPIIAYPAYFNTVTNTMLHEQHTEHTFNRKDYSTCKILMLIFLKGPFELFLKFLLAFNDSMVDMAMSDNATEVCREFRAHIRGRALIRFNMKYNETIAQLRQSSTRLETVTRAKTPASLTIEHARDMVKHVILGFGRVNQVKHMCLHVITCKKHRNSAEEDFLERLMNMNQCLELLSRYFPAVASLTESELKDAFLQAQPTIYLEDFVRSRLNIDDVSIEDLLEYFSDLQHLESRHISDSPRHQRHPVPLTHLARSTSSAPPSRPNTHHPTNNPTSSRPLNPNRPAFIPRDQRPAANQQNQQRRQPHHNALQANASARGRYNNNNT